MRQGAPVFFEVGVGASESPRPRQRKPEGEQAVLRLTSLTPPSEICPSCREVPLVIPTLLHHSSSCVDPKPIRDAKSAGVVVYRCPACGAIASSPRSA